MAMKVGIPPISFEIVFVKPDSTRHPKLFHINRKLCQTKAARSSKASKVFNLGPIEKLPHACRKSRIAPERK
ncbi:hypothetical protein JTE90_001685 [Oedothorax gibbosus]|uniref:Uncharacterized protein n=1 Tax=Oedothorax gibbosus TaxID=931172 RepID=A0AAV6TUM7_9ARAC|nr:hypothetical protein JTE90_001685 [Oedothorax gibbosus]